MSKRVRVTLACLCWVVFMSSVWALAYMDHVVKERWGIVEWWGDVPAMVTILALMVISVIASCACWATKVDKDRR